MKERAEAARRAIEFIISDDKRENTSTSNLAISDEREKTSTSYLACSSIMIALFAPLIFNYMFL